jgi:hypothetical protein
MQQDFEQLRSRIYVGLNSSNVRLRDRIPPFVRQDLRIIFTDIYEEWMADVVLDVLVKHNDSLEAIKSHLSELLSEHTDVFLAQLLLYAESALNLETFNRQVTALSVNTA